MAFCEDCGSPLTPGILFCENCGAKIVNNSAFSNSSKHESEAAETGIIYTDLSKLSTQTEITKDELSSIINSFIEDTLQRNVGYQLYDVDGKNLGSDIAQHVEEVKKIVEENHPDYLLILGSSSVIPSIVWANMASDKETDSDVSSDLCYATLDTATPFSKQSYDFDSCLKVGRLPNIDFKKYFENLRDFCGKAGDVKTFGESAEVWTKETQNAYGKIKNGPAVINCPDVQVSELVAKIPSETNLFLFNLHGSNNTGDWYGQRDSSYPIAVSPATLKNHETPYYLAVEACYGAAYEGRSFEKSILLSCLNGKCLSFMGSSRIAFGTAAPLGSCADVICEEHLQNLKKGLSAGESLNLARKELCRKSTSPNSIKTLAEFSLYGDPSARMNGMPKPKRTVFKSREKGSFPRGIKIPMPDVRGAVRLELEIVDQKIRETAESFVYLNHKDLIGVKPRFYKYSEFNSEIDAVFTKKNEIGVKIVSLSVTPSGQIKQMLESK